MCLEIESNDGLVRVGILHLPPPPTHTHTKDKTRCLRSCTILHTHIAHCNGGYYTYRTNDRAEKLGWEK